MFDRAMTPYNEYHHGPNPSTTETYYTFTKGKVSFFILDARSFRSPPPHREGPNSTAGSNSPQSHTMLGSKQLDKVKQWIREKDGKLKVLVSGVPFTRNWSEGGDEMDSWAGYLDEREEILLEFWKVGGGVIISGDRHEHGEFSFDPERLSWIHPAKRSPYKNSNDGIPTAFPSQPFLFLFCYRILHLSSLLLLPTFPARLHPSSTHRYPDPFTLERFFKVWSDGFRYFG